MEDLIKVTGFWGSVPLIEFISKRARQVSIQNERLNEHQVTTAMLQSCCELAVNIPIFIFFPSTSGNYKVVLPCSDVKPKVLADVIEKNLNFHAKGYHFERSDQLLKPLEVLVVAHQQLSEYLNTKLVNSNLPNEQIKPLHLSARFDGHQQFEIKGRATASEICNQFFVA